MDVVASTTHRADLVQAGSREQTQLRPEYRHNETDDQDDAYYGPTPRSTVGSSAALGVEDVDPPRGDVCRHEGHRQAVRRLPDQVRGGEG